MDIKKILVLLFALLYLSASFASATDVAPNDNSQAYSANQNEENLVRGDANSDGKIDLNDAHFLLNYIFNNGAAPVLIEGDADNNGIITISDAVWIVNYARENGEFILGDVNADGTFDWDDVNYLLDYIFASGPEPMPLESGDFDQNGFITISDAVAMVNYLSEDNPVPDQTKPVVTLISPSDNREYNVDSGDEKEVSFKFKVEDQSQIKSCALLIDDRTKKTVSNPQRGVDLTVKYDLDEGSYEWQVTCEDIYGNVGESQVRDLDINEDGSNNNNNNNDFNNLVYPNKNTGNSQTQGSAPLVIPPTNAVPQTPVKNSSSLWIIALIILIALVILMIVLIFIFR